MPAGHTPGHFDDLAALVDTAVYDRQSLGPGDAIDGPAIIEQSDTTLVIHPRQRASVRADRSILIEVMHASLTHSTRSRWKCVRNRLDAIAQEMQDALVRSAYSNIIKEGHDCSAALVRRAGEVVAQATALPAQLGVLPTAVKRMVSLYRRKARRRRCSGLERSL